MRRHRRHSIDFKRQIVQEYLSGASLHALAKTNDVCRNLIRIWVKKYEAGEFDEDAEAASVLHEYEAKIAALERKVGQLTMEIDFLKGALQRTRLPGAEPISIVAGPAISPSDERVN